MESLNKKSFLFFGFFYIVFFFFYRREKRKKRKKIIIIKREILIQRKNKLLFKVCESVKDGERERKKKEQNYQENFRILDLGGRRS